MNDFTYIKLYRRVLKNRHVMKDADHLAIWVWLLMSACKYPVEVDFGGECITLRPGQYTTGRKEIAKALGVNESKVYRVLKRFESEHLIEQQTDRHCTLITIVQWDKYQESEQPTEQEVNNQRTTSEQPVNTKKESKESKERNNNNVQLENEFVELWDLYPKDARRHYKAARKRGTTFDQVKAGIIAYKNYIDKTGTDPQYIKMGSSFFAQEAWDNDWAVQDRPKPKSNSNAPPEPPKYKTFRPEPERRAVPMSPEQRKARDEILRGLSEAIKEA